MTTTLDNTAGSERTHPRAVTLALLELIAAHPSRLGRKRIACAVGGHPAPPSNNPKPLDLSAFAVVKGWPRDELILALDTLIAAGWVLRSDTMRPTVELSQDGHHFRVVLEQEFAAASQPAPQLQLGADS